MGHRYHILDVFTDTALAGNPLAVVHDADDLDAGRMQAIAREFNLSETVFLRSPRDPVNTARVRIFTVARELPFAGHPTVGTALLLATLRAPEIIERQDLTIVLEEEIGPVNCTVRRVRGRTRASFTLPRLPEAADEPPAPAALAALLGLGEDEIGFDHHRPTVMSAGVPFTLVPLASPAVVDRARPMPTADSGAASLYLYARDGGGFHARMFGLGLGLAEDPATGSAAAALAGAILRFERPADGDHRIEIRQGVAMGRPSTIVLGLEIEGGVLVSASIGGGAVIVAEGQLAL